MALNNTAKNLMEDALAAVAVYVSLHTADPGASGTSEVTGGSPAYARKSITWSSASGGVLSASNAPVFDVPASTTVGWGGLWSASTAGTFYGGFPLGPSGTPKLFHGNDSDDIISVPSHGYSDTNTVVVVDTIGSLPTGLSEGTIYYVRDSTTDTFKLSATNGGSAINLTADGVGFVQRITTEVFGGQGTYTLSDVDITLG